MSELVVIGYPEEETADRVWSELVSLQRDYLIDLEDAAVIRRDRTGKFHVTHRPTDSLPWPAIRFGESSARR